MATPILLASTNPAKVQKLAGLLEGLLLNPIPLSARPDILLPAETGQTFEENARLKAAQASRAFGGMGIASDGGISIPALGDNWNSLFTGRAAGPTADDAAKAHYLLALMQDKRGDERRVYWTEALAIADRGQVLTAWQEAGTEGYLLDHYDSANAVPGFWVYSLWFFPTLNARYVDLSPEELSKVDLSWGRLKARATTFVHGNKPLFE